MTLRTFTDSHGVAWTVWPVVPRNAHLRGRTGQDRRSPDPIFRYTGPERRSGLDRRRVHHSPSPGMESGWLAFEAAREKRRLTPIPAGWEEADEAVLEAHCQRARVVPRLRSG